MQVPERTAEHARKLSFRRNAGTLQEGPHGKKKERKNAAALFGDLLLT